MSCLNNAIRVAEAVRSWAERNHSYYFKSNLEFQKKDLCGMCAICSYVIFKELLDMKVKSSFFINSCHSFVVCEKKLIDVTARQFDMKLGKIFVRDWPVTTEFKWSQHYCKNDNIECFTTGQVKSAVTEMWWPTISNPNIFFTNYQPYPSKKELYCGTEDYARR